MSSVVAVEWVRRNALSAQRLDVPNERSSHSVPTPRGGGLGIVLTVLPLWIMGLVLFQQISVVALGLVLAAGGIAVIGWIDDSRSLSARIRLGAYVLIGAGFLMVAKPIARLDIPLVGLMTLAPIPAFGLTFVWLVGFLNIFNFMDGIDGLAGSQSMLAGAFWWLLLVGQSDLAILAGLIAAASLGYLIHNLPPARIFMGDVGSVFLGFTLAALPVLASSRTENARLPVVGALFLAPFILDGGLTILRRLWRRENIFAPHHSHLYQRLITAGKSHRTVTRQYQRLMLLSGACGLVYYSGSPLPCLPL